ncbi:MAG: hypothetical protein ACQGVK_11280 [Myxococcota bacterium]
MQDLPSTPSMSSWILDTQLDWARRTGLEVDAAACVADATEQLLCTLSPDALDELGARHREPLGRDGKAGALTALDSTHVLLCHLVEPVRSRGVDLLDRALGGRGAGDALRLCAGLESGRGPGDGADGSRLECELAIDGPHPLYVLGRFREPYAAPDRERPVDPDADERDWRGLAGCRGLALDVRANPRRFAHLEVRTVLEAIRALTARHGRRGFRLVHLWFDGPGREARTYARELDRLRLRIGGDAEWDALGWRALFERLRADGAYDADYARSVEARYFSR